MKYVTLNEFEKQILVTEGFMVNIPIPEDTGIERNNILVPEYSEERLPDDATVDDMKKRIAWHMDRSIISKNIDINLM